MRMDAIDREGQRLDILARTVETIGHQHAELHPGLQPGYRIQRLMVEGGDDNPIQQAALLDRVDKLLFDSVVEEWDVLNLDVGDKILVLHQIEIIIQQRNPFRREVGVEPASRVKRAQAPPKSGPRYSLGPTSCGRHFRHG